MKVNGENYRAVWMEEGTVCMVDQRHLPFRFVIARTHDFGSSCDAIRNMTVRGAGTIGAMAGYAMAQAFQYPHLTRGYLDEARSLIEDTRPTARDLFYAVERVYRKGMDFFTGDRPEDTPQAALAEAEAIAGQYAGNARQIGFHGKILLEDGCNVLTHCNAGWLALVDHGSALSPVYQAFEDGVNVHVWIDETRPRNQGAKLTAWELKQAGIPHTIIPDNAAAYLMSRRMIDLVLTGADRIAANGDVANKIGTLEIAILCKAFKVPFFVAATASAFDRDCETGEAIPIEQRNPREVLTITGITHEGSEEEVLVANPGSSAFNPAFDVTPAPLVTAWITENGIVTDPKDLPF